MKRPVLPCREHIVSIQEAELVRAGVTDLLFLFSFSTLTSLPQVCSAQIISILLCISNKLSDRLTANQFRSKQAHLYDTPKL